MSGKVQLPQIPILRSEEVRRPAIIAQRKKPNSSGQGKVDVLLQQEIDQDLLNDFQVRDGMLVAAPSSKSSALSCLPGPSMPRRVIVVNTGDPSGYHRQRSLPGIADEVESYPCRVCNRIFLTDNGLLKHAEAEHPMHVRVISDDVQSIVNEWKRRELQKAVRKNIKLPIVRNRRNYPANPKSPGVYEVCNICDSVVKLDTDDAFEKHKKMHLAEGDNPVAKDLHCSHCLLTFMSHEAYVKHMSSHRKRSYLCHYCGARFLTKNEMNRHKNEYHEYRQHSATNTNVRSAAREGNKKPRSADSTHMTATCEICSSSFHRVDSLIRHVATVHQTAKFDAEIAVLGLPAYRISLKDDVLTYNCCDTLFTDKVAFCTHRQTSHEPSPASGYC